MQETNTNEGLIFGRRPIIEAIEADKEMAKVLLQKGLNGELAKELYKALHDYKVPYSVVPVEKLNRLTKKNHQGAVAFISPVTFKSIDNIVLEAFEQGENPTILVLDRITDVRNFGAIARSAECAGVNSIVIAGKGAATVTADAVKTSAGALARVNVCREENILKTIKFLKNSGLQIIACTEKAENTLYDIDYSGPVAIVMGSEEDGISDNILREANQKVKIPMLGNTGSLNVSVASGIILFEMNRQRLYAKK